MSSLNVPYNFSTNLWSIALCVLIISMIGHGPERSWSSKINLKNDWHTDQAAFLSFQRNADVVLHSGSACPMPCAMIYAGLWLSTPHVVKTPFAAWVGTATPICSQRWMIEFAMSILKLSHGHMIHIFPLMNGLNQRWNASLKVKFSCKVQWSWCFPLFGMMRNTAWVLWSVS